MNRKFLRNISQNQTSRCHPEKIPEDKSPNEIESINHGPKDLFYFLNDQKHFFLLILYVNGKSEVKNIFFEISNRLKGHGQEKFKE